MFERYARAVGVKKVDIASTERAPTQTVTNVAPVEICVVKFGDASGNAHTTLAYKIGGMWYLDQAAEEWVGNLRPASEWFVKGVEAAVKRAASPEVPAEDAVPVLLDAG